VPPVRLDLGDPAEGVAVDAEQAVEDGRGNPPRDELLDQRDDAELVLAHPVVRLRQGEADRLAEHPEELHRDTGLRGDVSERACAERGDQVVQRCVEPPERELAGVERLADRLERQPRAFQALVQANTSDVAFREDAVVTWNEDADIDQPGHEVEVDARPIRDLSVRDPAHQRTLASEASVGVATT
jgi:hypothetical protein